MKSRYIVACLLLLAACYGFLPPPLIAQNSSQKEAQAKVLCNQGIDLMRAHRAEEGVVYIARAAALQPGNAIIQYNLGAAYGQLDRWREAWQAFDKATRIAPNDPRNWFALSEAYAKCGDKTRALQVINLTRKRFPRDASVQASANQLSLTLAEAASFSQAATGSSVPSIMASAYRLSRENKYSEAAELMKQVLKREPQNWQAQHNYSVYLCKAGRFNEALGPAKEASRLQPDRADLFGNIMYIQTQIGDLDGLQAARKEFVSRFPNDPRASGVNSEIKYYQEDFANIKEREKGGATSESAMEENLKFSRSDMPLKVYVHDRFRGRTTWSAQSQGKPEGIPYSSLVEQAFSVWSAASGKTITFQFIDNADYANIECEWTDDRSKLVHSFAAGVTQYQRNKEGKRRGRIHLLTMPESENFNSAVFLGVSLHEIGHALGLSHSSNPDDIMYFSETFKSSKTMPSLSPNDTNRIRTLYNGSR